jgi:hypothetical protein
MNKKKELVLKEAIENVQIEIKYIVKYFDFLPKDILQNILKKIDCSLETL